MTGHQFLPQTVIEGLVEGLGDQGYAVIEGFLTEEECRMLRLLAEEDYAKGVFRKAGIGKERLFDDRIRGDYISWIDPREIKDNSRFFLTRMASLALSLNRHCYFGIRDMEFHYAIYPAGKGYRRHLDVLRHTRSRRLSVICYLNESWETSDGGELRLYLGGAHKAEHPLDILPVGRRLVCFLSDQIEHEVLPAARQRYSITGWLKDTPPLFGDPIS